MAPDTEAMTPAPSHAGPNPWRFVPFLYITQAIPVTLVQELSTVFYKDLGIDNALITIWTSIISLPWSLQFLLGPLVDLSAQKRKWVFSGQIVLTALLAFVPFLLLSGSAAFVASLIFLAGTAFVSALTNIATDGYYLLSVSKDVQAAFAGIQTASFRVGKLFVMALVPLLVGQMMKFSNASVQTGGLLHVAIKAPKDEKPFYVKKADLHVQQGELVTFDGKALLDDKGKPITITGAAAEFSIENGEVIVGETRTKIGLFRLGRAISERPEEGSWQATTFPTPDNKDTFVGSKTRRNMPAPIAWLISLLALAVVYAILAVGTRVGTPEAAQDAPPTNEQRAQFKINLLRTVMILGFYAAAYFSISAVWKLTANILGGSLNLPGWVFKNEPAKILGIEIGNPLTTEIGQFAILAPIAVGLFIALRKSLRATEMGEAFSSFFRQRGIIAILVFMVFYRFAEAMVAKMSVLFLKDDLAKGGLALDNTQIGIVKGTIGVVGIILGGIVGGILVSRIGLKRGFWIVAALMHLPIFLYLYAAIARPSNLYIIGVVDFIDQFGYGLGYAAYTIYLMRVAQRGNHRTAHYAIGTGLGATFIAISGILGGVIQAWQGYTAVFASALLFSIPGLITLMFIPHDETASA
jgi:MFS transporter, PAT family, beta-lactamase induction signal transducer AmpG